MGLPQGLARSAKHVVPPARVALAQRQKGSESRGVSFKKKFSLSREGEWDVLL